MAVSDFFPLGEVGTPLPNSGPLIALHCSIGLRKLQFTPHIPRYVAIANAERAPLGSGPK